MTMTRIAKQRRTLANTRYIDMTRPNVVPKTGKTLKATETRCK